MLDRPVHRLWQLAPLVLLLTACSGDPGTGPVEVKWDRDVCTRCNMVLSDRQHAAQVRYTRQDGRRSEVTKFDDFGCAVLWLDQQPWKDEPGVEFWVTDYRDGHWIDARSARYVTGRHTPMQYGLGAQVDASADSMGFADARQHVYRIEQQYNVHGGNLDHRVVPTPSN
ncbi:MAG: nitrous oxide reductase accessory protein NosL [Gammaproteobacteria bacterium]|nr:nitrous oxide reductase accessory protein NosL [Gammaproteobacteria bacterium]